VPFINSVRGTYGSQGKFKHTPDIAGPAAINWQTYGSGVTVSTTGPFTYSVFNTSGSNTVWNKGAYSTNVFKAPFTLELRKNGQATDQNNAYAMAGILPSSKISNMIADDSSYHYGYNHYPVATNNNNNYYEQVWSSTGTSGRSNGSLGSWLSGNTFLVTLNSSGVLTYWNSSQRSTPDRTVTGVSTSIDWAIQVNNYSANTTWGGFYDIKIRKNQIWNGTSYTTYP
jgi:hypothetical protein